MNKISVVIDGRTYMIEVGALAAAKQPSSACHEVTVIVDGEPLHVIMPNATDVQPIEWLVVNHRHIEVTVDRDLRWIRGTGRRHQLELRSLESPTLRPNSGDGRVKAPIPGLIKSIFVNQGDTIVADQPLLILEAMKMENQIRAPRSGVVSLLNVSAGQIVNLHQVLAEIT
jgi:biotin carboxyl carrier protein